MDETVVNGAQLFYAPQFGIDDTPGGPNAGRNQWIVGLVNSAPYVSRLAKINNLASSSLYSQNSSVAPF